MPKKNKKSKTAKTKANEHVGLNETKSQENNNSTNHAETSPNEKNSLTLDKKLNIQVKKQKRKQKKIEFLDAVTKKYPEENNLDLEMDWTLPEEFEEAEKGVARVLNDLEDMSQSENKDESNCVDNSKIYDTKLDNFFDVKIIELKVLHDSEVDNESNEHSKNEFLTDTIPEDVFADFIENEAKKGNGKISPRNSPKFIRKEPAVGELSKAVVSPKVFYDYSGVPYKDVEPRKKVTIGEFVENEFVFTDESDSNLSRRLDVILEENSDLSDASGTSVIEKIPAEKSLEFFVGDETQRDENLSLKAENPKDSEFEVSEALIENEIKKESFNSDFQGNCESDKLNEGELGNLYCINNQEESEKLSDKVEKPGLNGYVESVDYIEKSLKLLNEESENSKEEMSQRAVDKRFWSSEIESEVSTKNHLNNNNNSSSCFSDKDYDLKIFIKDIKSVTKESDEGQRKCFSDLDVGRGVKQPENLCQNLFSEMNSRDPILKSNESSKVAADSDDDSQKIQSSISVKNLANALKKDMEKIIMSKMKTIQNIQKGKVDAKWFDYSEMSKKQLFEMAGDSNIGSRKTQDSEVGSKGSYLKTTIPPRHFQPGTKSPETLCDLARKKVLSLPYGDFVLKKIGFGFGSTSDSESYKSSKKSSTLKNGFPETEISSVSTENSSVDEESMSWKDNSVFIEFDLSNPKLGQTETWYGVRTAVPAVLVGLSPSQKKVFEDAEKKSFLTETEAAKLLDLHNKFKERRSYHESNSFTRKENNNVSITEIRKFSKSLDCLPLTNRKFKSQNGVDEYSVEKPFFSLKIGNAPESAKTRSVGKEDGKREKEIFKWRREDSEGGRGKCAEDENKKKERINRFVESNVIGNSRLLAILQNAISDEFVPELYADPSTDSVGETHEISVEKDRKVVNFFPPAKDLPESTSDDQQKASMDKNPSENFKTFQDFWMKEKNFCAPNTISPRQNFRPVTICCQSDNDIYVTEPKFIKQVSLPKNSSLKKIAEMENNEESIITENLPAVSDVIRSFEEPRLAKPLKEINRNICKKTKVQIDNEKYEISRRGDIAQINSSERKKITKDKRRSMPANLLSESEVFKQKMYNEYMSKLAERTERRQQKVIKMSQANEIESPEDNKILGLENEFIIKVREREGKLGIADDEGMSAVERKCQEMRSRWERDLSELSEDKEEDSASSKRNSVQLLLDPSADVEALPTHLRELLQLEGDEFSWFFGGDYSENMPSTVSFSPTFKATAPRPGVWSPAQRASEEKVVVKEESEERKKLEDEPIPPVWTPKASPVLEKKEFRPVNFESPTLPRKKYIQDDKRESSVPPPWQQPGGDKPPELAKSTSSPALSLPRAPNPTVTLLQKAREGHLPKGAHYLNREMKEAPDDVIIEKLITASTRSEVDHPRKIEVAPKKIIGIGPTTKEGIPLVLRSEVTDDNREKWYKRMYDSLHKYGNDDDYVTVKYRTSPSRKGVFSYQKGSSCGYQSEPESLNYNRTPSKCITLDRRRTEKDKENEFVATTLPRSQASPPRRDFREYRNQPGRIEDYEPGHSSISEVEANKWWDEVLEIFDKEERRERPVFKTKSPKSFTQYASGYISDPQYVYKRSEDELQSPPSSEEQKEAYRIIQKGGEIPLKGLRKPAPERPKDILKKTEIEYFPLSPTLTRIRVHKQNISHLNHSPFYLHPSSPPNSTLNYPSFPVGVCNSYSQIQIFSPLVASQPIFGGENQNGQISKDPNLRKSNKFSVQLQNISGSHEYVQIVPQPRNPTKNSPIYANIPDCSSRSCCPGYNTKTKSEKEKNSGEQDLENIEKHSQNQVYSSVNSVTFSDLKRIVPSIVDSGIPLKKPSEQKVFKQSEVISKHSTKKSLKKEGFVSKLPSRKVSNICVRNPSNSSKKILKKYSESKLPKKDKKKSSESEVKKIICSKDPILESKKKSLTKTSKHRSLVPKHSEKKKIESKKETETKTEFDFKSEKELSSDFVESKSNLSVPKVSETNNSETVDNFDSSDSEEFTIMSPIYESLDETFNVKPNVEEDVTEKFRSRSFSPDVRRKMFKLPDMNKPLPPKRKQSKSNATLKMWSKMMVSYPNHKSRVDAFDSNVKYLRDRIKRKLADDSDSKVQFGDDIETVRTVKKDKNGGLSIKTNKYLRMSRSVPQGSATSSDPAPRKSELLSKSKSKSPLELLKSKKVSEVHSASKSSTSGTTSSASAKQKQLDAFLKSSTTYSVRNTSAQEEDKKKSVKVTVAISSKGKELLKKTAGVTTSHKKTASFKSSSPCPSASSYKSGLSEKSQRSGKDSPASSFRATQSPTSRFISPTSSAGRISSSSRSISPSSTASKTKSDLKVNVVKKSVSPALSSRQQLAEKVPSKKTTTKYRNIVTRSSTVTESPSKRTSLRMLSSSESSICKDEMSKKVKALSPKQCPEQRDIEAEKNELIKSTNLVRTDSFFQNLFLRNSRDRIPVFEEPKLPSVLDRARKYQWRINWPETYKSEPSLSLVTFYLNQKRPVSLSKFKSLDRCGSSSRSLSPLGDFHSESFQMKLHRFDSLSQFGDIPFEDVSPDLKERSSSEPPLRRYYSSEQKHIEKVSAESSARTTPSSSRSRLTQSWKPSTELSDNKRKLRKITVRARSAGTLEGEKLKSDLHLGTLGKSVSSLNLSNASDHMEYQAYVLELMHSKRKCERFRELHKFYSNLERMGKLEETASVGDLRPRLRSEDVIDFDRWKKIRTQERAEAELKALVDNLVKVQKEKDLLFRASNVDAVRWKGDRGLRIKERSVEDLKEQFSRHPHPMPELNIYRKQETEPRRDYYKSTWRGNPVVDTSKSLTHSLYSNREKLLDDEELDKIEGRIGKEYGYSLKAWKNLSNEEINNLKDVTNELKGLDKKKDFEEKYGHFYEKYEISVPEDDKIKSAGESSLHVRCSSALSKSQTFTPVIKRKEEHLKSWRKSESVTELPSCWKAEEKTLTGSPQPSSSHHVEERTQRSKHFSSLLRSKSAPATKPLSENEKKRLSMSLSREVIEKMSKASGKGPLFPRETLGAIAAAGGQAQTLRKCLSPDKDDEPSELISSYLKTEDYQKWKVCDVDSGNLTKTFSTTELESKSGSSETSTKTVVAKNPMDVLKKVQYFEDLNQSSGEFFTSQTENIYDDETVNLEKAKTITTHHEVTDNREDLVVKDQSEMSSSKKLKIARKNSNKMSSSLENLNDFFGQQKQYTTYSLQNKVSKKPWKSAKEKGEESSCEIFSGAEDIYEIKEILDRKNPDIVPYCSARLSERRTARGGSSNESLFSGRSRSVSPDPTKYYRAYLKMVKCGAVRKLRNKFESWEDLLSMSSDRDFCLPPPPRRFASDPELTRDLLKRFGTDPTRVTVRGHEVGDVRWLKTKFEKNIDQAKSRGRYRTSRSPLPRSPITTGDRFMPRINVISKTAELQMQGFETCRNPRIEYPKSFIYTKSLLASPEGYCSLIDYTKDHGGYYYTGEVEKLRRKFERLQEQERLSILGQMYTSTPEVNELRNIAPYLECSWVAHRHPEVSKTIPSPELRPKRKDVPKKVSSKPRPSSSSPVRTKHVSSILKSSHPPAQKTPFADQKFDPSIHRPKYRYRPDLEPERRLRQGDPAWCHWSKPTVTFQDFAPSMTELEFPDFGPESPRKYVESEVTIHYKSPVRSEAKEMLSEDELARRQAESMKRIYKEERRRKYLQELQDMNSRRHTDNFIPSQKSPISLNRYDDFPLDPSLFYSKARENSNEPVTVARGLYDFVGRRPRELAFRRGDIIFIIRKLDKHWCEGELNGVVGLFPLSYVEVIPHNEISMKFGRARAKYDFVPQTSMELSAQKGDVITLIRRIDENWFEGRIGDKTGIIPVSYCHVLAMPQANRMSSRSEKMSKPVAAPAAHSLIHNGTGMSSKHYYTPYLSGVDSSNRSMTSSTSANYLDNHMTPEMLIDEALMQLDEEFDLKRTAAKPSTQNPSFRVNPRPEPALYQVLFNHVPNNDDELELIQGETVTVVEKCGDGWYIGSKTTDGKLGIFPGTHVRRIAPEFV